ncbi:hypothetical protein CsSME_00028490 [Camellia sinensis var. sinensis]
MVHLGYRVCHLLFLNGLPKARFQNRAIRLTGYGLCHDGNTNPSASLQECMYQFASLGIRPAGTITSHITSDQFSGLVMTQNSEEIVVMEASLNQGIIIQGDTDRSVADLACGMSALPPTTSYAGNFILEEPPLLGSGNVMSTTTGLHSDVATQTFYQAEANGKNKVKADTDPYEQLLWAVEALKAGGLNKQQLLAVAVKTVDDTFPTQSESSSSLGENREKGRRTRNDPLSSNPVLGIHRQTKPAPADPFANAPSKNPQTLKYPPGGHRVCRMLFLNGLPEARFGKSAIRLTGCGLCHDGNTNPGFTGAPFLTIRPSAYSESISASLLECMYQFASLGIRPAGIRFI